MITRRLALMASTNLTSAGVENGVIQDDWDVIGEIAAAGRAPDFYSLGDRKSLTIGNRTFDMILGGFDMDDKSDGTGKANTSWLSAQSPTDQYISPFRYSGTYIGDSDYVQGWNGTALAITSIYAEGLITKMPKALQERIIQVNKKYQGWNGSSSVTRTVANKIWVPSLSELGHPVANRTDEGSAYQVSDSMFQQIHFLTRTLGTTTITQSNEIYSKYIYSYWFNTGSAAERLNDAAGRILIGFCL